ncbi:MAG TPA: tetratricopeptide repeat protein [Nitrososphaera sp.]|nr:tetratricopeptide repeat protein [Nitrososphaera sp.]
MESQSPEHEIILPLVSKEEENSMLPLVVNVVSKYWGEDLAGVSGGAAAVAQKGSVLIRGIELAESRGFTSYIYRGSVKDLKKRIDQGLPPIVVMPGIQGVIQHALIVSGYNDDERRILTYVAEPDTVGAIPEAKFADDWSQDEMTTILLMPADMRDLMKGEILQFHQSNRMCFEAEALRQEKKTEAAVAKLLKAVELDKDNAQAWCLLAGIYNELGNHQALSCYETAIKLNPRYYLAYRGIGNYFLKKNEFASAESYYTKAIEINPGRFGPIYKNRAIVRMQTGNNAGAKEDLAMYLAQTPNAEDKSAIEQAIAEL